MDGQNLAILIRQIILRYFTNRLKSRENIDKEYMAKFSLGRISHPMRVFFLSLVVSVFTVNIQAQEMSEGWAAGEIVLEYVDGTCDTTIHKPTAPIGAPRYNVVFKYYRDDYGITAPPFQGTYDIMVYSPDNGINYANAFAHQVTLIPNSPRSVNQYCLNGNPVATQGAWYRSTNPIELWPTGRWFFYFVGRFDGEYRSPEDRNIDLGQTFFVETRFDLDCGYVIGKSFNPISNMYEPDTAFNEAPLLTPTEYVFDDPVGSFCVDKNYEFDLKAIRGNEVQRLEYEFAPVWKAKNELVNYITSEGYSITSPFPTQQGIDITDLTNRGIIRFTPTKPFAGPVPFFIKNFVDRWWIDPDDINEEIILKERLSIMSQREYRFIFDRNCNSRLPRFIGGVWEDTTGLGDIGFVNTYNATEDAYEYDCATTEFVFRLSEPVLIESLGLIGVPYDEQDQGFRFASIGVDTNFLDDIPVEKVENLNVVNIDETNVLRVTLSKRVGPGKYYLYMKKGDDLNTLVNRCETTLPEYDTLSVIYVNGNYTYNHKEDGYSYCFPAGKPPEARLSVQDADYVGWRYYGGDIFFPPGSPGNDPADDKVFYDTVYLGPKRLVLNRPDDPSWVSNDGAGWWQAGAGFDFSTFDQQTGLIIEERVCFGWDNFFVEKVEVDDLKIPNFDLCPREDLPVIDLSAYKTDIISSTFDWGKWDGVTEKFFFSQYADPTFPPPNDVPDSLGRDYQTVSTFPFIFDTKGSYAGVGDTNYFRAKFNMRSKDNPAKTCPVQVEFKVLKQLINIELNVTNDTICDDETLVIRNLSTDSYFIPEQYSYQWYIDEQINHIGDTMDTIVVSRSGIYKLEVTKTTDSSACVDSAEAYVLVAPYLGPVEVGCDQITFNDGDIEQTFAWNTVPFANRFEVREVKTPDGTSGADPIYGPWVEANYLYGIQHKTRGPRIGLEVRAVNENTKVDAECRYGPASYAEPCEAIVKSTNVFTPNGDGINDFLRFDLIEVYPGSKLIIYNRWGKSLYEDDNYSNDWDGENFKEGTYFYVIEVNNPEETLYKGTFTIIRQ